MTKKHIFIIALPILVLITALGVSSILSSKADNADFVMTGDILTKYSGMEANITIGSEVETIGREAFADNTAISSVVISEGVKYIDPSAFKGCINLKSVTIPDSLVSIGDSAFSGCISLSSVNMGSSLSKMGNGAFSGCSSLPYVTFSGNSDFKCENGCIISSDGKTLYQYLAGYPGNVYRMPDSVVEMLPYSFWGASNLNEVTCSSSLSKIPSYGFANCYGLQNVVINTPTNNIGIGAFLGDSALLQAVIPISVSTIDQTAFDGCPSDMIIVCEENSAASFFADSKQYLTNREQMISIANNGLTANNIGTSTQGSGAGEAGSVPDDLYGTLVNGQVSSNSAGSSGQTILVTPVYIHSYDYDADPVDGEVVSDTKVVSDRAFIDINKISVLTGASEAEQSEAIVYSIPAYSHYNDKSISDYNFSNDDTSIGMLSFARSSLTTINIPDGIIEIGYGAFYHCDNLENVYIPATVKYVGEYAFVHTKWYDNWLNDEAADDFLVVGDGVLIGYKGQEPNPTLPDNVKTVADGVF